MISADPNDPSASGAVVPFRALIENSSDCSVLLDAQLQRLYVSPAAWRVFGYSATYLTTVPGSGPIHRDDVRLIAARLQEVRAHPEREADFEYRVLQPDGEVRWYNARCRNLLGDPDVRAIVVNSWEITERRRIEMRLRSSEALFRAMVENSSDMVNLLAPDGTRLYVSPSSTRVCGYAPQELKALGGKGLLGHPEDIQAVRNALKRAIRNPDEVVNVEYRMRDKAGGWRWIEAQLQSRLADPHLRAVVGNARDISEHKRLESELSEQADRLRQVSRRLVEIQEAERLALSRELHDRFGQALALLNANLQLVKSQLAPDAVATVGDRIDDCVHLVSETVARMRDLMGELRPAVLDDFGLATALRAHARQVAQRAGVRVETSGMDADPAIAPGCAIAFFRVIQEALNNAIKHSRAGRIEIAMERAPGRLTVVVADDGIGFDVPTAGGGNDGKRSWGLAIMTERMETIGGDLRIDSAPGRGTRIVVSGPECLA